MFTTGGGGPPRAVGRHALRKKNLPFHFHGSGTKKILAGLRPAGRMPARRYTSSWLSGRPARFSARRYTSLGPVGDISFDQNPSFSQGFIRVWLQKGGQIGSLSCSQPAGRPAGRPAQNFLFFFLWKKKGRFFFWPARLGGRQAPHPPRERGRSVVNNYASGDFRNP